MHHLKHTEGIPIDMEKETQILKGVDRDVSGKDIK